jgi:hypothetical protein
MAASTAHTRQKIPLLCDFVVVATVFYAMILGPVVGWSHISEDPSSFWTEAFTAIAALVGYLWVRNFRIAALSVGWTLLLSGLLNDLSDEVYPDVAFFDLAQEVLLIIAFPLIAAGFLRAWKALNRQVSERDAALAELTRVNADLQKAMDEIQTLRGIIPICAECKKTRDDNGAWNQIEDYIRDHSEADFSHGICPECRRRLYPELS